MEMKANEKDGEMSPKREKQNRHISTSCNLKQCNLGSLFVCITQLTFNHNNRQRKSKELTHISVFCSTTNWKIKITAIAIKMDQLKCVMTVINSNDVMRLKIIRSKSYVRSRRNNRTTSIVLLRFHRANQSNVSTGSSSSFVLSSGDFHSLPNPCASRQLSIPKMHHCD